MKIIDIGSHSPQKDALLKKVDEDIASGKNVFLFIYMVGCHFCDEAKPEWTKIKNSPILKTIDNVVIVSIDREVVDKLKNLHYQPAGFPTILHICNHGKTIENYEDFKGENERTIDSFMKWIQNKCGKKQGGGSRSRSRSHRRNTMSEFDSGVYSAVANHGHNMESLNRKLKSVVKRRFKRRPSSTHNKLKSFYKSGTRKINIRINLGKKSSTKRRSRSRSRSVDIRK